MKKQNAVSVNRKYLYILLVLFIPFGLSSESRLKQIGKPDPARTAYDVQHYDIHLRVDPSRAYISGYNRITFRMLEKSSKLRFDLVKTMKLGTVNANGRNLKVKRNGNAFYIEEEVWNKDSMYTVDVYFEGSPQVAVNPPWDGGFVWKASEARKPWVGLACESLGASIWMPCKDLWNDEAEGMDMYLSVPDPLTGVSNGKLISVKPDTGYYRTFHWQVKNPINNYNISVNVGDYTHISDTFYGKRMLTLDYYVLNENREKAERHFLQVKRMLEAFEHYFGPYPFTEDGYKLVETHYWGMEHQSCVAYGNNYLNNAFGFDFIIIHESGHEWFANSITASDPADMWIHESFTTYSEALYLEYVFSEMTSIEYLLEEKKNIVAKRPMIGKRDVFFHNFKDNDIYYKGSWLLHTFRNSLDNDSLWFSVLRHLNDSFRHKLTDTKQVTDLIYGMTGYGKYHIFEQYLYQGKLPVLEIKRNEFSNGMCRYVMKLKNCRKDFSLPVHLYIDKNQKFDVLLSNTEVVVDVPITFDIYTVIELNYLLKLDRLN